jgi:hypothetical protein
MARMQQNDNLGRIIKKAWEDESFKQRLFDDATAVFNEEGIDVPEDMEVKVIENTEKVFHLVLPSKHVSGELTQEQLSAIAGGPNIKPPIRLSCQHPSRPVD